ncbi:solute carrier family 23 member 2-like [Liolophura sinensis]|uniref:solute carrier family 23 member 2-like n=1 Tax=Liolophura sinensis TaxID=3198878 RepID=UPI0031584F7F
MVQGETGTEGKGVPPDVPEYTDNENRNDGSTHANGSKTAPDKSKVKRQLYDRSASTQIKPSGLYYDVPDNPPIHLATMFGFQIAMTNIFSCVNMAVIVSKFICSDQEFAASLYSTTSVMSGICTILQTSLGVRLPVFQGPSILFTLPYMNAATEPAWGCQSEITDFNSSLLTNGTISQSREQPWLTQWNKIQGSLMAASGLQIVIGAFGLGGLLLRAMGPISITCLILLLGLSIQSLISVVAEIHWGMSCLNIVIIIIISQYVNRYNVPMPTWSRRGGFKFVPFPLFELFPVLLSVIIGWVISYIFTVCGLFPDDSSVLQYQARTDFAIDSVRNAPVFTVPYPGQYGAPSIKLSYFVMIAVVVLASILESVGDYVQTTGPSRVAVPPPHAINRGIIMEGLGSFLSGAMGAGHATTSYSNTIGMIGITKVASRRVFNIAGLIMILMGVCGKLGAVFVAIPKPVLVGPIFIAISLLVGAALSNLKAVDLWSSRSQGVLGIAIMAGTVFPTWLQQHPGTFKTGVQLVN